MDLHIFLVCVLFFINVFQAESKTFTEEDCPGKLQNKWMFLVLNKILKMLIIFHSFLQFVWLQLKSFHQHWKVKKIQKISKINLEHIVNKQRMTKKKDWLVHNTYYLLLTNNIIKYLIMIYLFLKICKLFLHNEHIFFY